MITKFNKFENQYKITPEIDDYILLNIISVIDEYKDFINNKIGQIVSKNNRKIEVRYFVDLDDFLKYKKYFRYLSTDDDYFSNMFYTSDITQIGETIEEVELKNSANKFNI